LKGPFSASCSDWTEDSQETSVVDQEGVAVWKNLHKEESIARRITTHGCMEVQTCTKKRALTGEQHMGGKCYNPANHHILAIDLRLDFMLANQGLT